MGVKYINDALTDYCRRILLAREDRIYRVSPNYGIEGTFLQGYLEGITYAELCELFSEPTTEYGYKTRACWTIVVELPDYKWEEVRSFPLSGNYYVITIYDWKQSSIPLNEVEHWNIGGHSWFAPILLDLFFEDKGVTFNNKQTTEV